MSDPGYLPVWARAKKQKKIYKNRTFQSEEEFVKGIFDYAEWARVNPIQGELVNFNKDGRVTTHQGSYPRMLTKAGFCLFHGKSVSVLDYYYHNDIYLEGMAFLDTVLNSQNIELAAANLLNSHIVTRVMGLTEKIDTTSSDGSMTPKTTVDFGELSSKSKKELLEAMAKAEAEKEKSDGSNG